MITMNTETRRRRLVPRLFVIATFQHQLGAMVQDTRPPARCISNGARITGHDNPPPPRRSDTGRRGTGEDMNDEEREQIKRAWRTPNPPELIDMTQNTKRIDEFTLAAKRAAFALHNFGIQLRTTDAYKRRALSINRTSKGPKKISWRRLSRLDKQLAILNATITEGDRLAAAA